MSLPPNFYGMPSEEQHHYYRNVCIDFKKTIKSTQDTEILADSFERFLNASRGVSWPHPKTEVYRKDQVEKTLKKVTTEFQRYHQDLKNSQNANPEDLLSALAIVESMIDLLKVR